MGADYSTGTQSASRGVPRWRAAVVLFAAVTAAALTARLGVWQLSRASQKELLQSTLEQHYRRVRLQGEWLQRGTVFLENRQMNGRPGFYVLQALRLASGDAVVVQRGWAPRDLLDRTRVPQVAVPAGPVEVIGQLAPPPGRLYDFAGPASTGPVRQNIDLAAYSAELGVSLRPLSVLQSDPVARSGEAASAAASSDGLLRHWPAPALGVGKHHGYAFQWFALCALITGLYVWFQLLRPRYPHRRAA
jgi:surfeit locus 1 family protein